MDMLAVLGTAEGGVKLHKHYRPVTGVSGGNGAMPTVAEASVHYHSAPAQYHVHVTGASDFLLF